MDEAKFPQVFMAGKGMTHFTGDKGVGEAGAVLVSAFAPGIIASAFNNSTGLVSNGDDGA